MNSLNVQSAAGFSYTCVSDCFLEQYMPKANGEFVKVYLYLLKFSQHPAGNLSVAALADIFNNTEADILRALHYWEKEQLLILEQDSYGNLSNIILSDLPNRKVKTTTVSAATASAAEAAASVHYSPSMLQQFASKEENRQLLFIAEQYMGKTLSFSEMETIYYFYDELHFSVDLIEYLIEYCVSKGSKSIHYMQTVALSWHKQNITTVAEAKQATNLYNKNCFTVMKAFGIKGRNPVDSEIAYIQKWTNEYAFPLDIIIEACNRTIQATHQPNFPYADRILKNWHEHGVKHSSDIHVLDEEHQKKALRQKNEQPKKKQQHNFQQRSYDYAQLEQQLLNINQQ